MEANSTHTTDKDKKKVLYLLLLLSFLAIFILCIYFLMRYFSGQQNAQNELNSTNTTPINPPINDSDNTDNIYDNKAHALYPTIAAAPTTMSDLVIVEAQTPKVMNMNLGSTLNVPITLNPNGKKISGVDITIAFSSDILAVDKVLPGNGLPIVFKGPTVQNGTITATLGASPTAPMTQEGTILNITVHAKAAGAGRLYITDATRVTAFTYRDYLPTQHSNTEIIVK